ncbi:MAG: hypothetical protein J07HB67_00187 [halophilic archaeon J07HB67]|jgi:hypothetical protein|nr:MAG: hypothetical protein J07HB67_00187 [halophilic archaeon J07HB67]
MAHSTPTDSREQTLAEMLAELATGGSPLAVYDREGTFRSTEPTTTTEEYDRQCTRLAEDPGFTSNEGECYRNAQRAARGCVELQYVEGVALPAGLPVPVRHAWVEVDETVLELDWGESVVPDAEAAYLGVEYDTAAVEAVRDTGDTTASPVAATRTPRGQSGSSHDRHR